MEGEQKGTTKLVVCLTLRLLKVILQVFKRLSCQADFADIDQNNTLSIASNLLSTPSTHPPNHHYHYHPIPTPPPSPPPHPHPTTTGTPRTLRNRPEREKNIPRFSSHEKRAAYLRDRIQRRTQRESLAHGKSHGGGPHV